MKPLFPDIIVNGVQISAADIAAEAQNHPAPKGKPGIAWQAAARALVVQHLLRDAATGLEAEPQEIAPGMIETPDEARMRALMDQQIQPAPISDADLRETYDENPDMFRAPDLFEASHILFAAGPDAMQRAELIHQELKKSPESFAEIARQDSACSSRDHGGFLGQLSPGDTVPEFESALKSLAQGAISAPVETRFGVHLIRLDAVARGNVLPFEAVRDRLRDAAEKSAWTRAARDFTQSLIDQADISGISFPAAA